VPDSDSEIGRSTSTTSSLAYYFSKPSSEDFPSLRGADELLTSPSLDTHQLTHQWFLPAIQLELTDKDSLVSVSLPLLAGPRHGQNDDDREDEVDKVDDVDDGNDHDLIVGDDQDGFDSPWTIEAVNSGSDEKDEVILPILSHLTARSRSQYHHSRRKFGQSHAPFVLDPR
jgi:dual specificity tyrosine-phosphorylation-regulated kinase 2/3/4